VLVPRLWTQTVEAHRAAVREAVLDAVAALVAEHGLASVTMSGIAERAGVGRATLYKYFPDVEAVLLAWHERQLHTCLAQLAENAGRVSEPGDRLVSVCQAFADIHYRMRAMHVGELAALLHRGQHVARAHRTLHEFFSQLLDEAAAAGQVRDDVAASELASYCVHALIAARLAESPEAVSRIVRLTLAGLQSRARQKSDLSQPPSDDAHPA
jgi:AcrR family transcriptional regulator